MSDETTAAEASAEASDHGGPGDGDTEGVTAGDEDRSGELTVEELVATLERVTAERDQHLDDLQRMTAEFSNFRKQTDKRHADFVAHATARLAEALLPVLDACDAGAQQGVEGVEQIGHQLVHALEQEGLEVIADEGAPFDPNRHEAAFTEPGDDGQHESLVGEVLRTGYAWNGRVLRAAMVKVKG